VIREAFPISKEPVLDFIAMFSCMQVHLSLDIVQIGRILCLAIEPQNEKMNSMLVADE
jgi:hypothetical protein